MKKILLIMISGMFLLTFINSFCLISAVDDDYIGKQYENMDIIETCVFQGAPCDRSYSCNITIINPNQDVIVLNLPMTKNNTIYNYTLTNTNVLGSYKLKTYCTNGTFSGENVDGHLKVTTTGKAIEFKTTIYLLLVALVLFIIALFIKNHSIGFISGALFLVAGIYIMVYGLGDVSDMYTRAIALITLSFGLLITLTAGWELLDDMS